MKLDIREDSVEIEGYVNAVERNSRPLRSRIGEFVEKVRKGAFKRAISRNKDIHILLNHDWNRDLGSTEQGNLELCEDSIGLKARATITDPDVINKARQGDLVGWSFGFNDRDVEQKMIDGQLTRAINDLDLYEVSLIDRTKRPAYEGTLVNVRSETEMQNISETFIDETEVDNPSASANAETPPFTQGRLKEVDNPSVGCADSSLYTREPKEVDNPDTEERAEDEQNKQEIDYSEYDKIIKKFKED